MLKLVKLIDQTRKLKKKIILPPFLAFKNHGCHAMQPYFFVFKSSHNHSQHFSFPSGTKNKKIIPTLAIINP